MPEYVWHITCEEEYFSREADGWYRSNTVYRQKVNRRTGNMEEKSLLQQAHARVMYDEAYIDKEKIRSVAE